MKTMRTLRAEKEKSTLKFIWNLKGPQITKTILKKHKVGGFTLLDFKTSYKTSVIETVWSWCEGRHTDQFHRTESPEMNPCMCGQVISDMVNKATKWERTVGLQQMVLGKQRPHAKERNPSLTHTQN